MPLSRLEIFGFKSFANKLDLRIDGGITAVVGPNGCGKTNVVDAIRWVLGEQRPRFLRGERMEDVIFNGSGRREPVGMAEVSLTMENTGGMLPIEYNEVTVTRRLFRSGESTYLINRTACRLMDIENILMDTGIGPHSYSVIEQGMVDAIISENPEDRRKLFEEASGITKYKARRKSTLQRLSATEDDLLRLGDIIGEIERQVGSLRRQVSTAERYQTSRKQLRDLEIQTARFHFGRLYQEMLPLSEESAISKENLEALSAALRKKEAQSEQLRLELISREREVGEKDVHIRELDRALHQRGEEIAVWRERIGALERLQARSEEEEKQAQSQLAEALAERDTEEKNEALAVRALAEQVQKAATCGKDLEELELGLEKKRAALAQQRKTLSDLSGLHVRRTSEDEQRRNQVTAARDRLGELEKERQTLEAELSRIHEQQQEIAERVADLREQLSDKQAERARLVEDLDSLDTRLRALHRNRDTLEAEQRASREQLDFWCRMRETYEGYSESVRALLLDSPIAGKIRGVIGDLIEADEAIASAVEHALGPLLQALVVEDTRTAQDALKFLDNSQTGRAIFLPLDRIAQATSASAPTRESGNGRKTPQTPGVQALLEELIRCDTDLAPIVRVLFGDTVMVDTLDHALYLSEHEKDSWTTITQKGEMLSCRGEIIGGQGNGDPKERLLGRRRQIEDLEQSLDEKSSQLETIFEEITRIQTQTKEKSDTRSALDERIEQIGSELLLLDQRRAQGGFEEKSLHERSAHLDGENQNLEHTLARLDQEITDGQQELATLTTRKSQLESALAQEEQILPEEEAQCREARTIVHELRVEIAATEQQIESLRRDLRRLEQTVAGFERAKVRHHQEAEAARESMADLKQRIETGDQAQESASQTLALLEQSREELDGQRLALQQQSGAWDEELRKMRQNQEALRTGLHDLEGKIAELTMEARNLYARIQERYKVDMEQMEPLGDEEPFDPKETEHEIQRLRDRIERIGPVNLAALDEYTKEKERYEFLTRQRDDLVEARDTLNQTIVEINRRARKQFTETFEEVRRNFQNTFVAFFGGGEANLSLEEKDDPLDAEVRISVRPQGKRLQHLSLLSGGEKALTAIALLFAIYQKKPGPFCILDEVDAALDDANIGRFVEVVKQFSKDTQFIMITHNKRTMEASDRLYGITMEELGVSQLVSVRFGADGNAGQTEVMG
ncbi:MAG: chromosome segregation protein SMC [Candidatus Latescibacterota bacterium]